MLTDFSTEKMPSPCQQSTTDFIGLTIDLYPHNSERNQTWWGKNIGVKNKNDKQKTDDKPQRENKMFITDVRQTAVVQVILKAQMA